MVDVAVGDYEHVAKLLGVLEEVVGIQRAPNICVTLTRRRLSKEILHVVQVQFTSGFRGRIEFAESCGR